MSDDQQSEFQDPPSTLPISQEKPPPARLVFKETVYHQATGEQPVCIERVFTQELTSDEQPYIRKSKTKGLEQWQAIDCGWVEQPGVVFLTNDDGLQQTVQPTEEHRSQLQTRVLLVSLTGNVLNAMTVGPGECQRISVPDPRQVRICSLTDSVRYTIHVFPR